MSEDNSAGGRAGLHRQAPTSHGRRVRVGLNAFGAVILLAAAAVVATHIGRDTGAHDLATPAREPTPTSPVVATGPLSAGPPTPELPSLTAEFGRFESTLDAVVGIAVGAVGSTDAPILLGDWASGPAWSTIKVPLALAALQQTDTPGVTGAMRDAITESDNAAAESIWATLGDPVSAASKVEGILRQTGDPTVVQSQQVRPPFTAFGQTDWSLAHQVQFISSAACTAADAPVLSLMGQIAASQSWGLGTIADTRFKGGWGPLPTGNYLVRQFGVVSTPKGMVAVAVAAEPTSGQFNDGTADLTEIAGWLTKHLEDLPRGQCST